MAKPKVKVKIVEITNNLLPSKPKLYKPALQTPTVVTVEKFIENIAKETGLSRFQASNVLSCIFQTAGDYMELGNAVQLHEDFGTLKPYLKVKAVSDKDKCNSECIMGMGLRLIPTGKMRNLLGSVQFVFMGMSKGDDVEESEVVVPEPTTTKYTLTFRHNDADYTVQEYAEGETVTAPTAPEGYEWENVPATMPAENVTVNSKTAEPNLGF